MASPGVVLSLAYLLFLSTALTTAISQKETNNDNASGVSNTQSKCHNMYTSNSFYAGPNKKIEAILLDIKEDLGEMQEEIKSLKQNKTKQVIKVSQRAPLEVRKTHKACFDLAFFRFPHKKCKNCEA